MKNLWKGIAIFGLGIGIAGTAFKDPSYAIGVAFCSIFMVMFISNAD